MLVRHLSLAFSKTNKIFKTLQSSKRSSNNAECVYEQNGIQRLREKKQLNWYWMVKIMDSIIWSRKEEKNENIKIKTSYSKEAEQI